MTKAPSRLKTTSATPPPGTGSCSSATAPGAVVVEANDDGDRGVVDCLLHTNGDEAERLWTKAARQRLPALLPPGHDRFRRHRPDGRGAQGLRSRRDLHATGDPRDPRTQRPHPRRPRSRDHAPGQSAHQRGGAEAPRPARTTRSSTISRTTATPPPAPSPSPTTRPSNRAGPRRATWSALSVSAAASTGERYCIGAEHDFGFRISDFGISSHPSQTADCADSRRSVARQRKDAKAQSSFLPGHRRGGGSARGSGQGTADIDQSSATAFRLAGTRFSSQDFGLSNRQVMARTSSKALIASLAPVRLIAPRVRGASGDCRPLWPKRKRFSSGSDDPARIGHGLQRGWPGPSLPTGSPDRQSISMEREPS